MKEITGKYFVPALGVNLTAEDLNNMIRLSANNYMSTEFKALDDSMRAGVVNYMISDPFKPWFNVFMALSDVDTQKCYGTIIDYIEDSVIELCDKIEDAFNEVWADVTFKAKD